MTEAGQERQYFLCSDCMGAGCEKCQDGEVLGSGVSDLTTDAAALFQSYRWLHDFHILPRVGGMVDQAARFIAAVDFIDLAHSKMRDKKEELREKKAAFQKSRREKRGVGHG